MSDSCLVMVDLQNAYFNSSELEEQRDRLVAASNELLAAAKQHKLPVFNILTQHERNQSTWTLNMFDDEQGFLFDGDEVLNVAGLKLDGATKVYKTRDSAFYDTNLAAMLRNLKITNLIIAGVSTHTCIFQTAADAYAANFRVTLAADAVASHDPAWQDSALAILHQEYRQNVWSNVAIIAALASAQ